MTRNGHQDRTSARAPWIAVHGPWLSFRVDRRVPPVLALALVAMLAAMTINIGVGDVAIAPLDVLKSVLRLPTGDDRYAFVVNTLRMPRMLVAAMVGLGLGISGAITQGLTRNPLADPGILGISAGAGLVAAVLIVVVGDVPAGLIPLAAFGGALAVALVVYLLAWRGGDSPMRLILVGIGLSAVCGALTSIMVTFGGLFDVQRALIWLSGSVYGRTWAEVWALAPWLALFVPLAFALSRDLNALNLGEDVARGLGSPVTARRALLLLVAVALAAASVAVAGTIGFVGLMAPHITRRLVGPDHAGLLPAAGVIGALLVVLADLAGRTLFAPIELPVGLVTAAIGAPFFVMLLIRR